MRPLDEKTLIASVLNWIRENKMTTSRDGAGITEDIDLITNGQLDSLGLVDLLLFVEEQTGRKIDLKTVEPKDICVVKNLCKIAMGNHISQSTGGCEHAEPSCGDVLAAGRKV
jgi:acyl carrier protein